MVDWLAEQDVVRIRALIHPDHYASVRVAQNLGLESTATVIDNEALWIGSLNEIHGESNTLRT
jgi:RimJ/RimL family protein N-acetyltransferase